MKKRISSKIWKGKKKREMLDEKEDGKEEEKQREKERKTR